MAFEPIRTERLILRAPRIEDADAAFARRNLAEVARFQDWELPYTREQAERSTAKAVEMDGPTDGAGWSLTVVDAASPETILGDLYVELKWGGRVGYFGYTFHPDHWGRGYASEAARALVHHFFAELGVSRVEASLHPDNLASARVLEACGLVAEGMTRGSFWVGDVCSDDLLYGLTRTDWAAWCERPRHRPERIELVPLSPANVHAVAQLEVHWSQRPHVAPRVHRFGDLVAPPVRNDVAVVPWARAVEADGEIVAFVMAADPSDAHPHPVLMTIIVDRLHQRRGIGSMILDRLEERYEGSPAIAVERIDGPGFLGRWFDSRGYLATPTIGPELRLQ